MSSSNTRISFCFLLLCCGSAIGQNGALRVAEPKLPRDHTVMTSEPSIQLKWNVRLDRRETCGLVEE